MKPLYAILGTLIITAIAGYYSMCAYIVHTTGTTDGPPHIGEATADIIKALRPVSQVRILSPLPAEMAPGESSGGHFHAIWTRIWTH